MSRGSAARGRRVARRAEERGKNAGVVLAAGELTDEEFRASLGFEAPPDDWAAIAELAGPVARRDVLVAAGEDLAPSVRTSFELTQGSVAERQWLAAALQAGYGEQRSARWPSEAELADVGEVIFREEDAGVYRIGDAVALVSIYGGWCRVNVFAAARDDCVGVVEAFQAQYPPMFLAQADDGRVPITFWTNTEWGPSSRLRRIDSASWVEIEGNYSGDVRGELARLMSDEFVPGADGQLLLWQGEPGTGKTWALRALATEWADWAEFQYITDPDAFFVKNPAYMVDVLLHESYEYLDVDGDVVSEEKQGGKWRVLILEDTGELLAAQAKDAYGQGLSRLLNVVDGMVGQGLRVLAIVTTNDELGDLHPAAVRPGRCASQLSFGALSEEEAKAWAVERAVGADLVEGPKTLAELYDLAAQSVKVEFADGDSDEPADDGPMSGQCSCGHMANAHNGDMNDGACSMDTCDCASFEPTSEQSAAAEPVQTFSLAFSNTSTDSGWVTVPDSWYSNGWTSGAAISWPELPQVEGSVWSLPAGYTVFELTPDLIREPEQGTTVLPSGTIEWTAVLAPEGQATDDGRIFAPGSIEWRELPLSLMGMTKTADGHDGAEVCGRIDRVWRDEASGLIMGQGEFDTGEFGSEIARLVADGTLRGLSVDIAVSEMEVAYRGDIVDEHGLWAEGEAQVEEGDEEKAEEEAPSILDVIFGDGEDTIFVVRKGVIGAATVCPFPAFAEAKIEVGTSITAAAAPNVWTVSSQAGWRLAAIRGDGEPPADLEGAEDGSGAVLTASAAGMVAEAPPADWFADPELEELTPLTIDDDGRVYGHAAPWDQCHIGLPGGCTTAPSSVTDYAYFHLKEVLCDDGARVQVGTITLDTGHAPADMSRGEATAHYDNTGTAVADVRVGEDDHGIWFAGALRPDVDALKARKLMGAALSGDWRDANSNLELVGLLAVNVPGFPVRRPQAALAASGDGFVATALLSNTPVTEETIEALALRHRTDAETSAGFAEIVEALAEQLTDVLDEPVEEEQAGD